MGTIQGPHLKLGQGVSVEPDIEHVDPSDLVGVVVVLGPVTWRAGLGTLITAAVLV